MSSLENLKQKPKRLTVLTQLVSDLRACERCPDMQRPVITGIPVLSPVMLIGQAPGVHEGRLNRPFAWTAGKTMFGWFEKIGVDQATFRANAYMAAVCRCFPGKNPKGGDRVPNLQEIANCSNWLRQEMDLIQPQLLIPVGRLAIAQIFPDVQKLDQIIGTKRAYKTSFGSVDVIALPHPSGASTWHRMEPGKSLLDQALTLVAKHPGWRSLKGAA